MRMFLDEAVQVLPQVHAALDHERPDVVLYDIGGMAGPVAAERWGVPAAQLSPSIVAWDGYPDDMAAALAPMLSSPGYLAYREAFDDWLADSELSFDDVTGVPPAAWCSFPCDATEFRPGRRPVSVRGPCLDPARANPGDWREPAGDGPLTLVAFGTSYTRRPDVFRNVIAALDGTGGGWCWPPADGCRSRTSAPFPTGFGSRTSYPGRGPAPRRRLCHTRRMGSCTEALWSGVPTVAVPQAVDQFGNADRLVAIGVGVHPASDPPSPDELRAALVDVASDPTSGADSMPSAPNCIATVGRTTLPTRSRPSRRDMVSPQFAKSQN